MEILFLAALTVAGFLIFVYFVPVGLWIAALASGAKVGIGQLIAMRLRRVPPSAIVNPRISAVKAGLDVPVNDLEAHYLAGGSVATVVNALISADKAGITLDFARAAAIDLAGRDVLEAVKMSVNPKVIQTPKVAAMAADGIQLVAVSRITLRANIDRLVGGASEVVGSFAMDRSLELVDSQRHVIDASVHSFHLTRQRGAERLIDRIDHHGKEEAGADLEGSRLEPDTTLDRECHQERTDDGGGNRQGGCGHPAPDFSDHCP